MRGCAFSLFLWLAGAALSVAAAMAFFHYRFGIPPGASLGASFAAGAYL